MRSCRKSPGIGACDWAGCVSGAAAAIAERRGVEVPGRSDECYWGDVWCNEAPDLKLVVSLAIMDPNDFCECLWLNNDIVPDAEFNGNSFDHLMSGWIVFGLKQGD